MAARRVASESSAKSSEAPSRFMQRALRLAARGIGNTSPNPLVGAVIVADGRIVGEGFHQRAGAPHAEVEALKLAGKRARGATLYVTLEPCVHYGRTPPCTNAIARAGVARVVIAIEDPDRKVRGRGIRALRRAGISVSVGDGSLQAREQNRFYIKHRRTGLPYVTLKLAQTLDGFIARHKGERTRISGSRADAFTRTLRIEHDAVMIGVGTAIVDDPKLTVRPPHRRAVSYRRVIVDSRGRLPLNSKVVRDQRAAQTIVATTASMPQSFRHELARRGVAILTCDRDARGRVDVRGMLRKLGRQGMLSVLCEGGTQLSRALLAAHCVDRIHWLIAPLLFGANTGDGAPAVPAPRAARARVAAVRRLGRDVLVSATLNSSQ